MKKFIVTTAANLRDFTDCTYPQGSFYFSRLLKSGDIRVNGAKVRRNCPLNPGDEVVYYTTPKMESKPSHSVIYAGQSFTAVDKFSGVSTEALARELGLLPVHRLDRNTSGVILFASDAAAQQKLFGLFRERSISKEYIAVCKNAFARGEGDLTAYLRKDEARSFVTISDRPARGCEPIRTQYKVLEERGDIAMVSIILHTGKTHQIRAHMAHIGCPVLGDEKYGDESLNALYGAKRQLLCAYRLFFSFEGEEFCFRSALAPSFPQR